MPRVYQLCITHYKRYDMIRTSSILRITTLFADIRRKSSFKSEKFPENFRIRESLLEI